MPGQTEQITIYVDGGSRGNPGPAASAFILTDQNGTCLQAKAFYLGHTTNNIAEYTGSLRALEAVKQIGAKKLTLFSDSELLVKQINGQYRVKNERIRPIFQQIVELLGGFESWRVQHVTRDKNKEADRLVNKALDIQQDIEVPQKQKTQGRMNYKKPITKHKRKIRLGVLISGSGTTLMNILEHIKSGRLNAEVAVVISSRSKVSGLEKAKAAGLNSKVIRKKDFPDIDEFSKHIESELIAAKVDLVIQGGWLCLWKIPAKYEGHTINIHPALLPSFGGKGMWGHNVHEAVLASGCKITGCTVHFCTNEYDKGPIIIQMSCPVEDDDTPESLAARVFKLECIAYPKAITLFLKDKLFLQGGRVKIKP